MSTKTRHVVVLSGSGISAESGLATFRGREHKLMWDKYDPMEVATPEAWARDPARVLEFYNLRRQQVRGAVPNAAHEAIARLEEKFRVSVITQNVDDLHERAGSSEVLHLHGQIRQGRSERDPSVVVELEERDIHPGDTAPDGAPLRPNVVWFGEAVTAMEEASWTVGGADLLLVVGTSLTVYPAAGLATLAPKEIKTYVVDPAAEALAWNLPGVTAVSAPATEGLPPLVEKLMRD